MNAHLRPLAAALNKQELPTAFKMILRSGRVRFVPEGAALEQARAQEEYVAKIQKQIDEETAEPPAPPKEPKPLPRRWAPGDWAPPSSREEERAAAERKHQQRRQQAEQFNWVYKTLGPGR